MLVLVHGPPAAGKTTVATALRQRMKLPLLSRDALSERLYDSLGVHDEAQTAQIGDATYALQFDLIAELARGSGSFIVEGTFNPDGAPARMAAALRGTPHECVEVFLHAPADLLLQRYRERTNGGDRHPGHRDALRSARLPEHLARCRYRPMRLGGPVLEVDTRAAPDEVIEEVSRFVLGHGPA